MKTPSLMEMLQAGVHFGHQLSRWHPKMKPYIFTSRNGVHVIDLEQTKSQLEKILPMVEQLTAEGKNILFITTKPQAKVIVEKAAKEAGMPYLVERWIGGLLTNFVEMKRLFKKYNSLKQQQQSGELERYTKHEQVRIAKELEKMDKTLGGLATLEKLPDAIFISSVQNEKTAVTEANKMGVPIFGICDTNSNPDKVDYVIPANDDAVNSITMIVDLVAVAAKAGREKYEKSVKDRPVVITHIKKTVRRAEVVSEV